MGRLAKPREIVNGALFLASDESSYVTGSTFLVDGGLTAAYVTPGVMRVALMIEGQEGVTWEQWLALAHAAEEAGLEGLFRSDHYRSIVRGEPAGSLDAWATLAGLAAVTTSSASGRWSRRSRSAACRCSRRSVTTVDHISGGRVELGIGAGWFEAEHEAYGLKFPPLRERLDELDRQLAEIVRQWTEAPEIRPKPVQQPRPPIIVGGTAKPRTVRAAVALRRRVQHRLAIGRRGARAQARPRRGRARGRPRRRFASR